MMTQGELEFKRNELMVQWMGLKEQINVLDLELAKFYKAKPAEDPRKPEVMYQDYKSW